MKRNDASTDSVVFGTERAGVTYDYGTKGRYFVVVTVQDVIPERELLDL